MSTAAWILVAVMASFSISAILVWFWSKKNGLIDENIKYRMLEDND